ncbi:hypothetical protein [Rhizobium leguminosarum]|uniref:hypothetical protein n=1 Tax=Rhizobium leguminosarum TaxID=384 RepID=UPI001FF04D53|nr:hypothetical protein [Rhizobium leguminosarum]
MFQSIRQWLVELCVDMSWSWPLSRRIPWWLLTNYPSVNDVMNVVDAVSFLVLVCLGALAATVAFALPLAAAAAILRRPRRIVNHLAQAFIPLASASLFCGLLALTTSQLGSDGVVLPGVDASRGAAVVLCGVWSSALFFRIGGVYSKEIARRILATVPAVIATALFCATWLASFL